jgi:NADH-quinone oxidoreductase subunit J
VTFASLIFYLLGLVVLIATVLAVTARNLMHAVVHLIISFVGTAMLFYLLGASLLAALEVIVYAGAIMVLFVFIVMTLAMPVSGGEGWRYPLQWLPAGVLCLVLLVAFTALLAAGPSAAQPMSLASTSPLDLGVYVFQRYWLAVEVVSFLLFAALAGALYLGRKSRTERQGEGR